MSELYERKLRAGGYVLRDGEFIGYTGENIYLPPPWGSQGPPKDYPGVGGNFPLATPVVMRISIPTYLMYNRLPLIL